MALGSCSPPIGRPVRATITLYPIGRPVRATITLYPIVRAPHLAGVINNYCYRDSLSKDMIINYEHQI